MRRSHQLCVLFTGASLLAAVSLIAQDKNSPPASTPVSQPNQQSGKAPLVRSTANLVIVDVAVSHNGHPVKSLERQTFRLLEDGREQTIKSFEEHGPEIGTEKSAPLPPNTYTNASESSAGAANVLLLDSVNTPISDQAYARKKIMEYLKTIPAGSTRMAIFTLGSRLRLVKGFTTDSALLLAALNKTAPVESIALPGNQGESAVDRFAALTMGPTLAGAGPAELNLATLIQNLNQFEQDQIADFTDRRIQITMDALKQLTLYLGALPGRKNVIWFSASFPLTLRPESPLDPTKSLHAYGPQLQQLSDLMTAARVAVYPVDARGVFTQMPVIQNRASVTAIGRSTGMINPNAFPTVPTNNDDAELATMLQLADQTGGTPFFNSNALNKALAQAIENGSSYYTLTYSPENKDFDGKFRKLQVKVAGHNYNVAYRHGYFADSPPARHANAMLSLTSPGLRPDAPPASEVLFRARVLAAGDPATADLQPQPGPAGDLAARLKPPVRRYWIEYTTDMHQVDAAADANGVYRSTLELIVVAYDQEGKLVNANRRAVKLGIPAGKYDDVLQNGYTTHAEIDLPEGEFWLRLAVHDVSADRLGSIEVPLRMGSKIPN